jgi:hypothetical protein
MPLVVFERGKNIPLPIGYPYQITTITVGITTSFARRSGGLDDAPLCVVTKLNPGTIGPLNRNKSALNICVPDDILDSILSDQ